MRPRRGALEGRGAVEVPRGRLGRALAGGPSGDEFAAQGNILVSSETVAALAESFEGSAGPLADRLLACLRAAQAAGGERRGQQSASLLVVERDG